ncbi:MAG: hypothetical protein ACRDK4_05060 [Solirubrobacteraceae bacterium]
MGIAGCQIHKKHSPANLTAELHHVIPVAWQLFWQPAVAPSPGRDPDGRGMLWDARTVAICPTGHRNVHKWIVELMHACKSEDPMEAAATVKSLYRTARGSQFDWAVQALVRFKEAGGSLQALVNAGEWGEA